MVLKFTEKRKEKLNGWRVGILTTLLTLGFSMLGFAQKTATQLTIDDITGMAENDTKTVVIANPSSNLGYYLGYSGSAVGDIAWNAGSASNLSSAANNTAYQFVLKKISGGYTLTTASGATLGYNGQTAQWNSGNTTWSIAEITQEVGTTSGTQTQVASAAADPTLLVHNLKQLIRFTGGSNYLNAQSSVSGLKLAAGIGGWSVWCVFEVSEGPGPEPEPEGLKTGQAYKIKHQGSNLYLSLTELTHSTGGFSVDNVSLRSEGTVVYLSNADGGKYYINTKKTGNGKFLYAYRWDAVPFTSSTQWEIAEVSDGKYSLRQTESANAGYLGTDNNTVGAAFYCNKGAAQNFIFEETDDPEPEMYTRRLSRAQIQAMATGESKTILLGNACQSGTAGGSYFLGYNGTATLQAVQWGTKGDNNANALADKNYWFTLTKTANGYTLKAYNYESYLRYTGGLGWGASEVWNVTGYSDNQDNVIDSDHENLFHLQAGSSTNLLNANGPTLATGLGRYSQWGAFEVTDQEPEPDPEDPDACTSVPAYRIPCGTYTNQNYLTSLQISGSGVVNGLNYQPSAPTGKINIYTQQKIVVAPNGEVHIVAAVSGDASTYSVYADLDGDGQFEMRSTNVDTTFTVPAETGVMGRIRVRMDRGGLTSPNADIWGLYYDFPVYFGEATAQRSLTAKVNAKGRGKISMNGGAAAESVSGDFAQGTSVTLVATASSGTSFLRWMSNRYVLSTNASITVDMNDSKDLTAVFSPKGADIPEPVVFDDHHHYRLRLARGCGILHYKEGDANLINAKNQDYPTENGLWKLIKKTNSNEYYLFNVGAKKYLSAGSSYSLTDSPTSTITLNATNNASYPYYMKMGTNYLNVGGSNQLVIDSWSTLDDGNRFNFVFMNDSSETVTLTNTGKCTFASELPLDFTDSELTAYVNTGTSSDNEKLVMQTVEKVEARHGLILQGETGAYNIKICEGTDYSEISGYNYLKSVLSDMIPEGTALTIYQTENNHTNYVLQDKGSGAKFYKVTSGTGNRIVAHRSYLSLPVVGNEAKDVVEIDDTTGIESLTPTLSEEKGAYSLCGVKVDAGYKGVVIINGKKVFKK